MLGVGEVEFIRLLTDSDLPSVLRPEELAACLDETRARWGENLRMDQQIVLAMIADMANEARGLTSH
ncbi:MAG: hypothetical protein ACYC9L_06795 [Sulfuricaulis sp.]